MMSRSQMTHLYRKKYAKTRIIQYLSDVKRQICSMMSLREMTHFYIPNETSKSEISKFSSDVKSDVKRQICSMMSLRQMTHFYIPNETSKSEISKFSSDVKSDVKRQICS